MTVTGHHAQDNGPEDDKFLQYLREIRQSLPGVRGVLLALAAVLVAATGLFALFVR